MLKQNDIRPPLKVYSLDELLELKIPKRQYLLSPWLQSQGLCMIYSTRGYGKTWLALEIAYTVASGGKFLSWEAENPAGVLYIDGEMALIELQERALQIDMRENKISPDNARVHQVHSPRSRSRSTPPSSLAS